MTPSSKDIKDFLALEAIYQCHPSNHGYVNIHSALGSMFPNEHSLRNWVNDMINCANLLKLGDVRFVRLSPLAEKFILDRLSRRDDKSAFKQELRVRLLSWANNNSRGDDDLQDVDLNGNASSFWYYGRSVTLDDLESAARYLQSKGLVKYESEIQYDEVIDLFVGITVDGEECCDDYEGDISRYLKDKEDSSRVSGPVFNIDTVINSNIVAGNENNLSVGQQATQRVVALGQVFRQSLPVLGMSESESIIAEKHISELEKTRDKEKINNALKWGNNFATGAKATPLSVVLSKMSSAILEFGTGDS